ncbi:uncharacterized protein O3Q21_001798 [Podargus strigoides]
MARTLHPHQDAAPMLGCCPPPPIPSSIKLFFPVSRYFFPRGREDRGRGGDTVPSVPAIELVATGVARSGTRTGGRTGADPSPAEPKGAELHAKPRPAPPLAANGRAPRPALPGASRAQPSPAEAGPERAERSRTQAGAEPNPGGANRAGPNGTGADRKSSERTERGPGLRDAAGPRGAAGAAGPGAAAAAGSGQSPGETEAGPPPSCPQVPGWGGGCESGRTTATGGCCTPCPPGFGVTEPCGHTDTRCQPCAHKEDVAAQPVTGDPQFVTPAFVPPPPDASGKDIIPVYCSLLAAVVVGLLAYVAFKCWHTCRQKQQLAKARAGDTGTSPEGEKLHSDSGVFLDTPSLQDPHQPGKAPRPEGHPLSAVPPQRQEELERVLESGGAGGDWRSLATHLGFVPEAIVTLGRGRAPTRDLLSAWATTQGATLETLCQALAAIGHHDVARRLVAPEDVTSAV